MGKLNQVIAIEKGVKSQHHSTISELYKAIQKPDLFNGLSRTYEPNEGEEQLPPERKRLQHTVDDVLRQLEASLTDLLDVTARKDWSNAKAVADVTVDGAVILSQVPVTYLLFLEKQLVDVRTFVDALPTLDEAEDWRKDPNGLWRTDDLRTHRTRKAQKPLVLYPATPEHPAQTQLVTEDVLAGFWVTNKTSGAMPRPEKQRLFERVEKLLRAVKEAREAANNVDEAQAPLIGDKVFNYLMEA